MEQTISYFHKQIPRSFVCMEKNRVQTISKRQFNTPSIIFISYLRKNGRDFLSPFSLENTHSHPHNYLVKYLPSLFMPGSRGGGERETSRLRKKGENPFPFSCRKFIKYVGPQVLYLVSHVIKSRWCLISLRTMPFSIIPQSFSNSNEM